MIELDLLASGQLPDAAMPVLESEHASAQSIIRYIDTFDQRIVSVDGKINFEIEQLFAAISYCATLEAVADMYLRPVHTMASHQLPEAPAGSALASSAANFADVIAATHPIRPDTDEGLSLMINNVRHHLLPGFVRQARSKTFPSNIFGSESQIQERTETVKAVAGYMGNAVIKPIILASRPFFLAGLESGLAKVQSREALNYFGSSFRSAEIDY